MGPFEDGPEGVELALIDGPARLADDAGRSILEAVFVLMSLLRYGFGADL